MACQKAADRDHIKPQRLGGDLGVWTAGIRDVIGDGGWGLVPLAHAQAAPQVEMADADADPFQRVDQCQQPAQRVQERADLGELGADVHGHPHDFQMGLAAGQCESLAREIDVDAELVLLAARRDLGVRAGIDVGIHADGDVGPHAELGGDRVAVLLACPVLHPDPLEAVADEVGVDGSGLLGIGS